jgi:TolB-like protein/class 3 adenylate cyclase/tetratricopeptide (TPR) repeat protein
MRFPAISCWVSVGTFVSTSPSTLVAMERKLAAILAADVVGYSTLMEADEAGTFDRVRARRKELFEPEINKHHGRIFKLMGDGLLAEFGSVVDAVECAVTLQRGMAERNASVPEAKRFDIRIGINLGEVIIEGEDRYGEGVNVAARLQELADPGGICVSGKVSREVEKKLAFGFESIGEQQLKNIAEPIACYRVSLQLSPAVRTDPVLATSRTRSKAPLALPGKPSIAVLPFQNMSGDPEQDYFADGMVEEIITALSRVRWLFVIARNSAFTYKGRAVNVKQVGRELGVRYVLEGSVRKAANRVRITGQLVDALTGAHLWADRFDGELENIFELQDLVTASVVGIIAPKLEQAEIERAKHKPTESLDAYDCYLRGVASLHAMFGGSKEAVNEALQLFYRAIELDPEFASPYGMAAWCYVLRKNYGWVTDDSQEIAETERLARRAAQLAKEDAVALYTAGFSLARIVGYLDDGAALIDRALTLDPNSAAAWHLSGWVHIYLGKPEIAVDRMARAMRLNPLDPLMFGMQNGTAAAHFLAGRYDDASAWSEKALRVHTNYLPAMRMAAASHACAGRLAEAQKIIARIRQIDPELRASRLTDVVPFRGPQEITRYVEALRNAGLPE